MLLASVADIVADLGFDSMTDITFAVTQAVDAAEAQLMSSLDSDFTPQTYVDTFYVDEPPYTQGNAVTTEFRLRSGLVTGVSQVLASGDPSFSGTPAPYSNGGSFLFGGLSGTMDVTANLTGSTFDQKAKDKGVLRDFITRYRQSYVQVTYTAGYPADTNNPMSYDLTMVPDWLQQAARLAALIAMADSPSLTEASIKLDVTTLKLQYGSILGRKVRYAPMAILPL